MIILVHTECDSSFLERTMQSIEMQSEKPDQVIHAPQGVGCIHHLYVQVHQMEDADIVFLVKGGDALAHEGTIADLKSLYNQGQALATYGGVVEYPSFQRRVSQKIDILDILRGSIEGDIWETQHCITFYAGLFKKIPLSHFLCDGKFSQSGPESLLMPKILSLAEEKAIFLDTVQYISYILSVDNITDTC